MKVHDSSITVWRLNPHHAAPHDALQWAKETGRLAIGWGRIGDIKAQNYSPQAIFDAVKKSYPDRRNAGGFQHSLHDFCYRIRLGDLVILRSKKNLLVMEVTGNYEYKPTPEEPPIGDYQHQRRATVLAISPDELWSKAGGVGQHSPYPPLVECRNPIDAETKTALISACSSSGVRETTDFITKSYVSADEVDAEAVYQEGAVRQVMVNAYERNPQAREQCITLHGLRCRVCSFDFEASYGAAGAGYIHVHHLRPLSDIGEQYEVNPQRDLCPVCANCHAVIHRRKPPYSIEEVKAMLKTQSADIDLTPTPPYDFS